MRISNAFLIVGVFCSLCVATTAQSPTDATPAQAAPAPTPAQPAPSAPPTPATLLQPALDQVQQTVSALKMEKWKRGTVRDEAGDRVPAILRDLHTTLPPLLDTANASPDSISKMLPVTRNVAALYDVLLSVADAARISATAEESTRLDQALVNLEHARLALDDRLQVSVAALEKQEADLRTTLQAREAAKCPAAPPPVTPVCPAHAPARRAKKASKPPATPPKPSTPPATSTPKAQN